MATYTKAPAEAGIPLYSPNGREVAAIKETITINDTELETGDIIELVRLPIGAIILDGWINVDDLDAHILPALEIEVGLSTDTDGLLAATTLAQSGGFTRLSGDLLYQAAGTTTEQTLVLAIATGAATPQSGDVNILVTYYFNS